MGSIFPFFILACGHVGLCGQGGEQAFPKAKSSFDATPY